MKKPVCCFALLLVLLLTMVASSAAQASTNSETVQEIQKATSIINENQILKAWQNLSDQIGVGTVGDVTCKYDKSGIIYTYVDISVDFPLTSDLNSGQTVVAKYYGGQIGDQIMMALMDWPSFPNDTITPP
jgi:hypothetical protein